jgi:hypothetical protein
MIQRPRLKLPAAATRKERAESVDLVIQNR